VNEFLNPKEEGDMLNIRVMFEGRTIPVLISREAMSDHFGAEGNGPGELVRAYVADSQSIDARVLTRAVPGQPYGPSNPLVIHTKDL
jgi:hypothetical protein